ncbi:MAG: sulfatase, partial [Pseudomonadota bacterium]
IAQVEGRDVPLHVIGPPETIARLDGWAGTPGLVPDDTAPVWPMEAFRNRFLAAFTSDGPAP